MPASGGSTFDGNSATNPPTTTPYRPGASDFNGIGLVDDQEFPPDPKTMPTANLMNSEAATLVVLARLVPVAVLSVTGGTNPSINAFTAAPTAVATEPASSTFTVTRNAAGDVSITWAANTFPAPVAAPMAALNVQLGAHNYAIGIVAITNGVRVTTTQDGALTDLSFTLQLF